MSTESCSVTVILFDFGGVLAEEGFREGLLALGKMNGLDPEPFMKKGFEIMHASGYARGEVQEADYWQAMREETGIQGSDEVLRREILGRFIIRPWMIDLVGKLKRAGIQIGILSDQTNWLDELNQQHDLFRYFDHVYNSYHEGKSKRDVTIFKDISTRFSVRPEDMLFIDDNSGNIERAAQAGLKTILYQDRPSLMDEMARYCPFLINSESSIRKRSASD